MPLNASETDTGARTYLWQGERYRSVTTIISGGVPKYLVPWAAKLSAEFAVHQYDQWCDLDPDAAIALIKDRHNVVRESAADLGKSVHAAAEAHALGLPMPEWPEDIAPHMAGYLRFLEDFQPVYEAAEATVYSRQYRYAGTGDAWLTVRRGRLAGVPLIVDTKSGKNVYSEVALQLSAYARAEFIGLPDGSEVAPPVVERGAVLHLNPRLRRGYEFREVAIDDDVFRYFRHAQQVDRWAQERSKEVLGVPEAVEEAVAA